MNSSQTQSINILHKNAIWNPSNKPGADCPAMCDSRLIGIRHLVPNRSAWLRQRVSHRQTRIQRPSIGSSSAPLLPASYVACRCYFEIRARHPGAMKKNSMNILGEWTKNSMNILGGMNKNSMNILGEWTKNSMNILGGMNKNSMK